MTLTTQAIGAGGGAPPPDVKRVGKSFIKMQQSALAKVGFLSNGIRAGCGCAACAQYKAGAFKSVGVYGAAKQVVKQNERRGHLENISAGVAKANGSRDSSLPDGNWRRLAERQLLSPTSERILNKSMLLAARVVLNFSIEARGATACAVEWSDVAVRRFSAMWKLGGAPIDVL